MSRRQRAYFSAVAGPVLLVTAFLTAGLALARLDPGASHSGLDTSSIFPPPLDEQGVSGEIVDVSTRPRPEADSPVSSSHVASSVSGRGGLETLASVLSIDVNYSHDWVAGSTDPAVSVVVTLTHGVSTTDVATVDSDEQGSFFVDCSDWDSGECPDIRPGDGIWVSADQLVGDIDPIGSIVAALDAAENLVSGEVWANWFTGTLEVSCKVWEEAAESGAITRTVESAGGHFECDFDETGWDLEPLQTVAVRYYEPDGDSVIFAPIWPRGRVDYARDQVGASYQAGHSFLVTVTDSLGSVKAIGTAATLPGGSLGADGFFDAEWTPDHPDVVSGDFVHWHADDGYTNSLEVGTIFGTLDLAADTVSGTILVPGSSVSLTVECQPWGAWEAGMGWVPEVQDLVEPDGLDPFLCDWGSGGEWDIQPGQDVAVMYLERDGDQVVNVFRDPAARLRVGTVAGGSAAEGGNFLFRHRYENAGDAPAESVVITDTLSGMSYLYDTSPFAVMTATVSSGEEVTLDLGTVGAGESGEFDLYVAVEAASGEIVTNTTIVSTSSYNQAGPDETTTTWVGTAEVNDTHLGVGKWARTPDPAPGEEVVFAIGVCNSGPTASSEVTLTDTLHPALTLVDWWSADPGWFQTAADGHSLVVVIPSISGYECREVFVRAFADAAISPGSTLWNQAVITAENDLESEDNEAFWEGSAGEPRVNIWIDKKWIRGQLVPGGELFYAVDYGNSGNLPVGPVVVTDTLPAGTTFAGAWFHDPAGGFELQPSLSTPELVAWEFPGIEHGTGGSLEIRLSVNPTTAAGTILVNRVDISPQPEEDTWEDNSAEWTEVLGESGPDLRIAKRHGWEGDEKLSYEVRFENVGDQPVSSVAMTDTLPLETTWDGWWELEFDPARLESGPVVSGGQLLLSLSELLPGENGLFRFNVDIDQPGTPLRWYTNTVEITLPPGDTRPADNVDVDVAFSGGEVERVEIWLDPVADDQIWGGALPESQLEVWLNGSFVVSTTTDINGEWFFDLPTPLVPGDQLEVRAGAGELPVVIAVPDPLDAAVNSATDEVFGQIGGWLTRPVEVEGTWPDGYREVTSDGAGSFVARYADIPRAVGGSIRFVDQVAYATVVYHRPFWSLDLVLDVDYQFDVVVGSYEPGHTVLITVTESDLVTVKGTAAVTSQSWPGSQNAGFSTALEGWQSEPPDLLPGDWVYGLVDNGNGAAARIGDIDFEVDYGADVVTGTLEASWITVPVELRCEVESHPANPVLESEVDPQGGPLFCDFGAGGWDIAPGQSVVVSYREPDADRIVNRFRYPQMVASIGPESGGDRYLWGSGAEPDASVVVTVTSAPDQLVATATAATDARGIWTTGTDLPEGALAVWNDVLVDFGNGITDTLTIYPMGGEQDPVTDVVTVTAAGEPFFTVDLEVCHPVIGCSWFGLGELDVSGVVTTNLLVDHGYDLLEGSTLHAQLAAWNDHQIRYSWGEAAAEVGVWKRNTPGTARPDGVVVYSGHVANRGSGPAENMEIVDTMPPGTSYADDTSGLPVTIGADGVITWSAGTLEPGGALDFAVTLDVDPATPPGPGGLGENCMAFSVVPGGDWNPDNDTSCSAPVDVQESDVDLEIDKWAAPADPTPGQEFDYVVRWCNLRSGAVGPVFLTDTLPTGVTLLDWRSQYPRRRFWNEVSSAGGELALYAPGLPGEMCEELTLRVGVVPDVVLGTRLTNTVVIDVDGDVDPSNNWRLQDDVVVAVPRPDLAIWKRFEGGVLVPGGGAGFSVHYVNNGNVESVVRITDTIPAGTSYAAARWGDSAPWAGEPFPDPTVVGSELVWDLPALPVNSAYDFQVDLAIDADFDPQPGLANCVAIAGNGEESTPADNSSCVEFGVTPPGPNLRIEKDHAWNGEMSALAYEVRFDNIGNEPVASVILTDTMPVGTIWNGSWGMAFDWGRLVGDPIDTGEQLIWQFSDMQPGESGRIWFEAALEGNQPPRATYTNTVEITTPPADVEPADNLYEDVASGILEGAAIDVEKLTNGVDADDPPGPIVRVGAPITWTYVVTNSGSSGLMGVTVSDSDLGTVPCPQTDLDVGQAMTCEAFGSAIEGQYTNVATASGQPPVGAAVEDADPSSYFGGVPGIVIEASVEGLDSDQPPGLYVVAGQPITVTYVITNAGNITLTSVTALDEGTGAQVPLPSDTLAPGVAVSSVVTATAVAGQGTSVALASGYPPAPLEPVYASDFSYYFGVDPGIVLEKLTNGEDADEPPGPVVVLDSAITWTYTITNTGNITLTRVLVDDDQLGPVACPTSDLGAGESMSCAATGDATAGQYENVASVTALPPVGDPVEDVDVSHYFGAAAGIVLEKLTNGVDADEPPGVELAPEQPITWTYVITNTGNITLTVTLTDDRLGRVGCPGSMLAAGEKMTCEKSGTARPGPYVNVARAVGTATGGIEVSDTDPSHYICGTVVFSDEFESGDTSKWGGRAPPW